MARMQGNVAVGTRYHSSAEHYLFHSDDIRWETGSTVGVESRKKKPMEEIKA